MGRLPALCAAPAPSSQCVFCNQAAAFILRLPAQALPETKAFLDQIALKKLGPFVASCPFSDSSSRPQASQLDNFAASLTRTFLFPKANSLAASSHTAPGLFRTLLFFLFRIFTSSRLHVEMMRRSVARKRGPGQFFCSPGLNFQRRLESRHRAAPSLFLGRCTLR